MLSRSFNPTKCKTSLRLAASRLKLLRNKKEVQLNQMKREIAQLLESGQDQTARIRVEHVIREEKMMAAYDLLEIYCELIIARLPIIETQKNCPIDLKEAITSLVFASPRCGDVPELLDARKQFSAKYGKEFISAAIELRPQCGVSRLLVEKLSATAPDGQTKIKILSAIAEAHNVKWDPKSFEEKLSGGPSSIKKENELYSEPPRFEAAEMQAHPSSNINSSPLSSVQQDPRISTGAESLPPAKPSGASTTFEPKAGRAGEEMPQLFQGDTHGHLDGHRWKMEFKDAASAAQAAAESAERASMAARAAAELSSHGRILGQHSAESHKSDAYTLKDDGLETTPDLNSFERVSEASVNKTSPEYTRLGNEQINRTKPSNPMTSKRSDVGGCGGSEEYSQVVSLKSKASADDDSLYHGVPSVHEYTQENSLKDVSESEVVMGKQSYSYGTENETEWPEKVENLGEEMIGKQKSFSSSYSQSGISDYVNIFANSEEQNLENDTFENPSVTTETGIHDEAPNTSSHVFGAVTFDQSDTDSDGPEFDRGPVYDEKDLESHLHSLSQISPERASINTGSWSPRSSSNIIVESSSPPSYFTREKSFPDITENTTVREDSELDNFPAVRFDDSDGPSSESDEDANSSKVEDSRELFHEQNERGRLVNLQFEEETAKSVGLPSKNEGPLAFGSEQFSLSSDDELNSSEETHWKRSQVNMFDADSSEKLGDVKPFADKPAFGSNDSDIELNDSGNESDTKSGEGLNFGKLTGGFRHKGHNHLLLFKNRLDASSSVRKEAETTSTVTSSTGSSLVEHPKIGTTSTVEDLHSESESDSSEEGEEKSIQKSFGRKQPLSAGTVKTKLTLGSSNSIFGSHDSDLDDDSPSEPVTRKSHLRSGISRRTKASSSSSTTNSNTKMHLSSEVLDSDGLDRKPTTSYGTETPERHESNWRNSGTQENYEQPISGGTSEPEKSNTWGSTEQPGSLKTTSRMKQESKERLKSGVYDSDNSLGKQPSSYYAPDTEKEFEPSSRKSNRLGKSEQQIPADMAAKPANSSSWGTSEKPNSGKATLSTVQKSKIPQKSSAAEELGNPQQKSDADASFGSESLRTSTLDKPKPKPSVYKDNNNIKTASHVHPKLPDYDSLVQSLRINRS